MSLTGVWTNSYGSVMTLKQIIAGAVVGTYKSSTGSTGQYNVVGFAEDSDPTSAKGQSASLSIYWRSTAGGPGDPSWHWVSGLSGQLNIATGEPTLYLLHAMVATDDFPGLATAGTYLDKLIYKPKPPSDGDEIVRFDENAKPIDVDPIAGVWRSREDPETTLTLNPPADISGYIVGDLATGAGKFQVIGFTDIYAQSGGIARQGLSLTDSFSAPGTQSLAGSLEFSTGVLTLTVFSSQGTPGDALYTQTKLSQLTFVKQ